MPLRDEEFVLVEAPSAALRVWEGQVSGRQGSRHRTSRRYARSTLTRIRASNISFSVRNDGQGGADFIGGTGLVGLKDRVEALGGRISLLSPAGAGTTLRADIPLTGAGWAMLSECAT